MIIRFQPLMVRHSTSFPFEDWSSRRLEDGDFLRYKTVALQELRTKADVHRYRKGWQVPDSEPCPRWLDCPCRHNTTKDPAHSGAVQQTWGQGVYCGNCGSLL